MTDTFTHPRPLDRPRPASPAPVRWHVDGPAEPSRPRRLRHIPALDGLRAAAVLAVMLYHGGVSWMEGGYLGVDAFFVLSGFLITALLLGEWRSTGGIAFGQFWIRRARRLLPALGLVALGVIAYGAFLAPADQLSTLRGDLFASLGYVTNWRMIFSGEGYFDQFAAPSPLRHVWSLAIEEQFYLVWPLVVYALMRWLRMPWRVMATLFGGLALASAAWMAVAFESAGVNRAYYGTDTRAQALLVGAALAVVYVSVGPVRTELARRALSVAAALAVGVTAWLWITAGDTATWLYEGGYFLAAIAIAAVITRVAQPRPGVLGAVLSWPPLQWIGRISYGLYLWHWPIYVVVTADRVGIDGTALLLVRLALTFAAATASYYLVELPVRNGALRGWRSWVAVPTVVGAIVAGALLVTSGGRSVVGGDVARAAAAEVRRANDDAEEGFASRAEAVGEARPTGLLVVGDSVALTLGLGLQEVGLDHRVFTVNRSQTGCGLTHAGEVLVEGRVQSINDYCDQAPKWAADVQELRPDVVLMLIGAWDAYDRRIDGTWIGFGTPEWDAMLVGDLQAGVDALSSTGAKVVLSTVPHYENRSVVNRPAEFKSAFDPWRVDHLNELIRGVVAANPGRTALVDLQAYIAGGQQGLLEDGVHFGVDSRKVIATWLAPRLREIARSSS
jgi:peptidoglycan/LPS O-acetylase OafA/YrhL